MEERIDPVVHNAIALMVDRRAIRSSGTLEVVMAAITEIGSRLKRKSSEVIFGCELTLNTR